MTEEEHAEWVRQATGEPLVTKSAGPGTGTAGNDAWADYFRRQEKKQRATVDKALEDLSYHMGRRFAERFGELDAALRLKIQSAVLNCREELANMREELAGMREERNALKAEVETLKKQFPARLVKSG